MANPQVETGHLKIADGLADALRQSDFSGIQHRILIIIMQLTYRDNKTKAEISIDDIRYLLGNQPYLRRYRLEQALEQLINHHVVFRQELPNGKQILGIQKDHDKWGVVNSSDREVAPNVQPNTKVLNVNNISLVNTRVAQNVQKPTPAKLLLDYVQKQMDFKYTLSSWRIEHSRAKKLYVEALRLRHSPVDAAYSLRDYIDYLLEDEWFKANIRFPLGYMLTRYEAWQKQIPRKPADVRSMEETISKRFKFNTRSKNWEVTNDKL